MSGVNYYRGFDYEKARKLILQTLKEDIGIGDITSEIMIDKGSRSSAEILVKETGIIAGLKIFQLVFELIDHKTKFQFTSKDGDKVKRNEVIGVIRGNTRSLLAGERTALNILQRMSGIATLTNRIITKLNNRTIQIIDTRKTTPNFRLFEKLAVRIGGGSNHRAGLYDMILIKDNHIEAAGGISAALNRLRKNKARINKKAEIEVKNIEELKEVLANGKGLIDRIMLDNFSMEELVKAVKMNRGNIEFEISGGVNEGNIANYRNVRNVEYISMGSLTHSAGSLDISLNFIT